MRVYINTQLLYLSEIYPRCQFLLNHYPSVFQILISVFYAQCFHNLACISDVYSIINFVLLLIFFWGEVEKLQCNGCCQGQYIDAKQKKNCFLVSGPRVIISGDEE